MKSYQRTLRQIVIFLGSHHGDILLRVVVITDQVKKTVNNDTIQFIRELDTIERSILPNRIDRDK